MIRAVLGVASLALALAGGGGAAPRPHLEGGSPCPDAPSFTCSTLTVPLDRTGRVPGALRLRVAAAPNVDAPKGVLLFLAGGPGQGGEALVTRIAGVLGPVAKQYRLVMFDQRGTGAGAIDCPQLQRQMGSSDLAVPTPGAVRACAAKLGAARSLYGTDDVVADMDDLRAALGVETWAIDGVSYGTFVGERYAIAHPERVAKLVLDSVVPHDAGFAALGVDLRAVARVLRAVCAGATCPGDPAADLASVVRARHNGPELLDALVLLSIADPTYRRLFDVPRILHDARAGRTAKLDTMLRTTHQWDAAPAGALSQGLHAAALCGDFRYPWGSSAAPLAGRERALARAVAALRTWPFDRATASRNGFVRQCLPWPPTPPTPSVPVALPAVPILFLAGDHDLSTPLEWARQEAARAPNGKLVVVPGAGHSVQTRARNLSGRHAVEVFLLG